MRLFGLETEYGIAREDQETMDPVVESMDLVRAHLTETFRKTWDYAGEDPHEDARGFRVGHLQQDQEEEAFAQLDARRPFSFQEMKSDLVLGNGARFYNDHTHPEYSTPECRSLRDLVAHDRAGERIVQRAADQRNRRLGGPHVQLYKNNTDFHGHSYGCHDNYLVPRGIPFPALAGGLLPFLVTRQLVAGAGKVGVEAQEHPLRRGGFQLSQRADFMEAELGVDTMRNRPILNTRDEPHADRARFRRLHLIVGDANMCEYATALKVGTTRVVLDLIERGRAPSLELEDPVSAIRQISGDPDLKATVRQRSGASITALELQEVYREQAATVLRGQDPETDWVLDEWGAVLRLLRSDRMQLVGKVDWVTKLWLLETFVAEERVAWEDPWLTSLDLEYHNTSPERGLFRGLEAEGKVARLVGEDDVDRALERGPADTRASVRGLCVKKFSDEIAGVQWERVRINGGSSSLDLTDLFDPEDVGELSGLLERAGTLREAATEWNRRKDQS